MSGLDLLRIGMVAAIRDTQKFLDDERNNDDLPTAMRAFLLSQLIVAGKAGGYDGGES